MHRGGCLRQQIRIVLSTCTHVVTISCMKLPVVMQVYNERATLRTMIDRVLSVPLETELLCVDDGSSDGSREILGNSKNSADSRFPATAQYSLKETSATSAAVKANASSRSIHHSGVICSAKDSL